MDWSTRTSLPTGDSRACGETLRRHGCANLRRYSGRSRMPRCLGSGIIPLLVAAMFAGCSGSTLTSALQRHEANGSNVPDFAGTAIPVSASACSRMLPGTLFNPFTSRGRVPVEYSRTGCWTGRLARRIFWIGEYFSPQAGGGLVVEYGGAIVGRVITGSGVPTIVRFTGDYVCTAERAGAYFVAVNLQTGARMQDEQAQRTCPPPTWPPRYVLGLAHRYPITWH
jgi:hypothetical protein